MFSIPMSRLRRSRSLSSLLPAHGGTALAGHWLTRWEHGQEEHYTESNYVDSTNAVDFAIRGSSQLCQELVIARTTFPALLPTLN
jgi:hypothetical protein